MSKPFRKSIEHRNGLKGCLFHGLERTFGVYVNVVDISIYKYVILVICNGDLHVLVRDLMLFVEPHRLWSVSWGSKGASLPTIMSPVPRECKNNFL